jgi:hypothetical protein
MVVGRKKKKKFISRKFRSKMGRIGKRNLFVGRD